LIAKIMMRKTCMSPDLLTTRGKPNGRPKKLEMLDGSRSSHIALKYGRKSETAMTATSKNTIHSAVEVSSPGPWHSRERKSPSWRQADSTRRW